MEASQLGWTDRWIDLRTQGPERDTEVDHRDSQNSQPLAKTYVRAVNPHIDTMDMTTTTASVSVG